MNERWYLSDTEANTAAHRLAKATHILLPESWQGKLKPTQTYPGILPQAYVPQNCEAWSSARGQVQIQLGIPGEDLVVFHRKITGDGVHDGNEVVNYQPVISKMQVHFVENKESAAAMDGSAWEFPVQATLFDGVITGSTTLAAEAVVQGVPTLLISKPNEASSRTFQINRTSFIGRKMMCLMADSVRWPMPGWSRCVPPASMVVRRLSMIPRCA